MAPESSAARAAAFTLVDTRHIGPNTNAKKETARRGPRAAPETDMIRLARTAAETAATATAPTAEPAGTCTAGATRTTRTAACRAHHGLRLAGEEPFALRALACELACAADRFRLLARLLLGGFFVMAAKLHFAENALALHLLLERLEGLVDVVVADENLQAKVPSSS